VTYVICEPCIDVLDKACQEVCPVDCIHYDEGQDRMLYIDPAECIDCGACEPACPVTAIFTEDDVPDNWKEYTQLNANWYKDKDGVRKRVNALKPA
jgi:NAD-dependent dihydropyrimidine dehydrogenase PreA subunit